MVFDLLLKLISVGFLSATVAFILSGFIVRYGHKLKIIDDPKKHLHEKNTHVRAVPRGGGLPIWGAVIAGSFFLPHTLKTMGILVGVTLLAVTGYLDDRYEEQISPYVRLVVNILAALCVIGTGIGIAYITNPAGGIIRLDMPQWCFQFLGSGHCIWILADLFALLWLVWMQNIVGWSSGVDGQLPGFVIVSALTMALIGMRYATDDSQTTVIVLSGIIAGAYAGFLPWNWYPQKIMPGYGGKSLAGFMLGILAIFSGAKVGAMVLVLAIPVVDAILVIFKRVKEGRSPVWGGRDHMHHHLLDMGWSRKKIAIFYLLVAMLFAVAALHLKAELKYFTMATVTLVVAGLIVWLQYWSISSKHPGQGSGSKT